MNSSNEFPFQRQYDDIDELLKTVMIQICQRRLRTHPSPSKIFEDEIIFVPDIDYFLYLDDIRLDAAKIHVRHIGTKKSCEKIQDFYKNLGYTKIVIEDQELIEFAAPIIQMFDFILTFTRQT